MLDSIDAVNAFRHKAKHLSHSGNIACLLFEDIENTQNRKPTEVNGNKLLFPKATWENIEYDKIKYKNSINNSKLKT